ncbi:MAG: LamG domain-containing protein [Planctomycetota bacterium]
MKSLCLPPCGRRSENPIGHGRIHRLLDARFTLLCCALGLLLSFTVPAAAQLACIPPANVTCTADAVGNVTLTWTNSQIYDQIDIVCGVLIAQLPGTATSFTFFPSPALPQLCCQVVGVLNIPGAPPIYCPSADCCIGCLPPLDVRCFYDAATGTVFLSWYNPQVYAAIEIECNGTVVSILSGTTTTVTLPAPPPATQFCCRVIGVIFNTDGTVTRCPSALCCTDCLPPVNVTCFYDPLVGGFVLNWTNGQPYFGIEIECGGVVVAFLPGTATSYVSSILPGEQVCCRVVGLVSTTPGTPPERCPSEECCSGCQPPINLTCTLLIPGGNILLSWTNAQPYLSINVYCNGSLVTTLPGTATSYVLTGVVSGTQICCQVAGVVADAVGLVVECPSAECCLGCAPPFNLQCEPGPILGSVLLTWINGQSYSQIKILCNSTLIATLGGTATSYLHVGAPAGTTVCYQIVGILAGDPTVPPTECPSQECCITTEIEFPCPQRDLVVLLNTGWDQYAGVITPNNPDDEWFVTGDRDPSGNGAVPPFLGSAEPIAAEVQAKHPAWDGPLVGPGSTGSAWIYHSINTANGFFDYQFCFCLREGFSNAQLSLDMLSDDRAKVYLNGFLILTTVPSFAFQLPPDSVVVTNQSYFHAGENCIKVVVENTHGVVTGFNLVGEVTATNAECCCVSPPFDMVGWWPLDTDTSLPTAEDIAWGNHGQVAQTTYQSGLVAESLFYGGTNLVTVADHPKLDFGIPTGPTVGDFSIDAWVRLTDNIPGEHSIVSKLDTNGTGPGYALFVDGSGYLSFLIQDTSIGNIFTPTNLAANVNDGNWHHVAVSYDRDRSLNGVRMYVDGNRVDPDTFSGFGYGNLSNAQPLYIGAGTFPVFNYFEGNIDEVEIFDRVLLAGEVRELYEAGAYGKCKERCHVPWDKQIGSSGTVNVTAMVCNDGLIAQTYNITSTSLSPGPGCSLGGPISITHPATVTVPAGTCVNVPITLAAPIGPGISCFRICFENQSTGHMFCCNGSLAVGPPIIIVWPNDPVGVGVGTGVMLTGDVTNPSTDSVTVEFRLFATTMNDLYQAVSLNGLPPGEPVFGTLQIAGGSTVGLNVDVFAEDHDAFRMYDLVLEADLDGDGVPETASSVIIETSVEPPVATPELRRADCNHDANLNIGDPVYTLAYLFSGGTLPPCEDSCDSNDDGQINIGDPVFTLTYLFSAGPAPPAPFPTCGPDPTTDALGCVAPCN